jgi:hypothetical protein
MRAITLIAACITSPLLLLAPAAQAQCPPGTPISLCNQGMFDTWRVDKERRKMEDRQVEEQGALVSDQCYTRFGVCQMPYPTWPGTLCSCTTPLGRKDFGSIQ